MDEIGYQAATGTYEEAVAMVGYRSEPKYGDAEVNAPMIRHFAAMVEDGNASYWDDEFARRRWGGLIAPPAMLMVWVMPVAWRPGGGLPEPMLMLKVPLPGNTIINVSNEAEFLRPVRAGDRLHAVEELIEVSELKSSRLGDGHYVTTKATFGDEHGRDVAISTNVLFRFEAPGLTAPTAPPAPGETAPTAPPAPGLSAPTAPPAPGEGHRPTGPTATCEAPPDTAPVPPLAPIPHELQWEDVHPGDELPPVNDAITYRRTVMSSATTWDWFPGHYDPGYARAQGQPTIFVNTMHLLGFVDRLVTDWAGPATFLVCRRVELRRPVYAGDTITGRARVTEKRPGGLVDIDMIVENQHGKSCVMATLTVALPPAGAAD